MPDGNTLAEAPTTEAMPAAAPVIPPASKPRGITQLDAVLAGVLCLAAVAFWFVDSGPQPAQAAAPSPATPATQPASLSRVAVSAGLNNEGMQFYSAANYAAAEKAFHQAIAADPDGALGYCNLGATLIMEGNFDEAIASLQHALQLDPSFTLARNNLAWAISEKAKHQH